MVMYRKSGGEPLSIRGTSGGSGPADMPNFGISVLTSAADINTLAPPVPGCFKIIAWAASGTSNSRIVELSSNSSGDSVTLIQGGTSGVAATEINIVTTDAGSIGLIGLSTNTWKTLWCSTGHAAPSTGIVFQAS